MTPPDELEATEDGQQIGIAAARMMQKIEDDYPEGVKVLDAMVLVEIEVPLPLLEGESEDDRDHVEIHDYYSTSQRRSTQLGQVELAKLQIMHDQQGILDLGGDDDDDES